MHEKCWEPPTPSSKCSTFHRYLHWQSLSDTAWMDGPINGARLKQLKTQRADYTHSTKRVVPLKKELKEKQWTKFNVATCSAWSFITSVLSSTVFKALSWEGWGRSQDPHFQFPLSSGGLGMYRGRTWPSQRLCKQSQGDQRKHPWSECLWADEADCHLCAPPEMGPPLPTVRC